MKKLVGGGERRRGGADSLGRSDYFGFGFTSTLGKSGDTGQIGFADIGIGDTGLTTDGGVKGRTNDLRTLGS